MKNLVKAALVFVAVAGFPTFAQEEEEMTREEVIDRIERVEAAIAEHKSKGENEHVQGATGVLEQLQAALQDFDSQNNGGGHPQGEGGGEEEDVFSILDQDQDGRISREEFEQGFEEEPEGLWDQEDKNGDGYIGFDEFGGPKGAGVGGGGGSDGGGSSDGGAGPTEVFYMMDTDGDNRISKEEFDAHFENLGVEPNAALFKRDDSNNNGFIEFKEFGGNKGNGGNLFAQLDVNADKRLSREEFTVEWHTAPIELFENDDKDGDGFVSFDEFGGPKGLEGEGGGGEGEGGDAAPENMFAILDIDSDNRISQDEFNVEWHNAPEGLWEQEDANDDGFISYDEFGGPKGEGGAPQGGAPPQQGGGEEEEDIFSVLDQDQDGRISREEFVGGFDGAENEPEGLWAQEDANNDGFISWEEFGGPKGSALARREL